MVTKQFNLRTLYRWEPVEYTVWEGEDSQDRAIAELESKENEDKDAIRGFIDNDGNQVGEKPHDTELEHVYHHWIRTTWEDDAGNELENCEAVRGEAHPEIGHENPDDPKDGATGSTVPESSDTQYDPEPTTTPNWHYGWKLVWTEKDALGNDVEMTEEYTWEDYTNPLPEPAPKNGGTVEKMWKEGKLKKTEFKLTSIVDREYWDEKYKGIEDGGSKC